MLSKIKEWVKTEILDDEYEMTALVVFGIGGPFILIIFAITLYMLYRIQI